MVKERGMNGKFMLMKTSVEYCCYSFFIYPHMHLRLFKARWSKETLFFFFEWTLGSCELIAMGARQNIWGRTDSFVIGFRFT